MDYHSKNTQGIKYIKVSIIRIMAYLLYSFACVLDYKYIWKHKVRFSYLLSFFLTFLLMMEHYVYCYHRIGDEVLTTNLMEILFFWSLILPYSLLYIIAYRDSKFRERRVLFFSAKIIFLLIYIYILS